MGKILFELFRAAFTLLLVFAFAFVAVVLFCGMSAWFFSLLGRDGD